MPNPWTVKIAAGETRDAALYINRKGRLKIEISTQDGSNRLSEAWWITWGIGSISSLGQKVDQFETRIPVNYWKGIVAAKLRARAAESDTVLTCYFWEK
jgi:hypothetical protein